MAEIENSSKNSKGSSTFGSVIWKFGERITAQLVSTLVSIVLARLLMPEDYGIVAIVMIFITFCNAFVTGGLGNALIQKKDADELDFSSVFYAGIFLAIILYLIIFFTAEPIADFYNNKSLIWLLRIMGLRIIIASINSVQQAYIARKMQFRKFFIATLLGTVISAVVGIVMAYNGYGPWSLVAQYMTNVIIDTIVLFIVGGWKPRLQFSIDRLKSMLPFGLKLMGTNLLDVGFNEMRAIVISMKYTAVDLAMYDNGRKYPNLIVNNINSSISSVIFPVMSKRQNDKEQIATLMKKAIRMSTYILAPLLCGFIAVSYRFVVVVLTEKWLECVPYICISSCMCLFYPIHSINIQAVNSIGESGKTLKLEIIKKVMNIVILLISMFFGVLGIALGALSVSLISTFINAVYSKKYFNYSVFKQLKDVLAYLISAIVMAVIVYLFDSIFTFNGWLVLFVDIVIGAVVYVTISYLFKFNDFYIILNKVKDIFKRRKGVKNEKI